MLTQLTLAAATSLSGAAAGAQGAVITHSGFKPFTSTSWSETLNIPQFDTMGGDRVLEQVNFTLSGTVQGTAQAESVNQGPALVTLNLSANITLTQGATTLGVVLPLANVFYSATTYDGLTDFGGTSGRTFNGLTATDNDTSSLVMGVDDLSAWIGAGTVAINAVANGASTGSGAGNLVLQFSTNASAAWSVEYVYSEVPTPGAATLAGLAGLGALRRRRR